MLTAERKALSATGDVSSLEPTTNEDIAGMPTSGWWNAVVPVAATVIAVLWLLVVTGKEGIDSAGIDSTGAWLREVFGNADSYYSLLWGTTAGLMTAAIMSIGQRLLTFEQLGDAVAHGAKLMLPAIAVLWLASCLSAMTGNKPIHGLGDDNPTMYELDYRLYTGEFLASTIEASSSNPERLAAYLPTIIFVLSAGISFATGTSWGTMAIVMPIAIPLIYPALANQPDWTSNPILACTVGSVLAGSIFGDHCSPISDTTVLSSQSCGCEHTAHVWTQMPYALVVGAISILCGTLPVGFGVSIWILLPVGVAAMVGVLLVFGRRADQ
jgi:Na+/H+ antiporter NhaC